ncbi:MAG TPA: alpha/beta hydrolase [Solirubrobacteraceae bacterium]
MRVPLDRSGAIEGTIRIRAVRIASRHATRPPIVGLTGGPGQAGVVFASDYDYILPTAGRDLVLFDQRGTGASGLLRCPQLERRVQVDVGAAAAACGRSLGPRRSFYTSADSADDIEALRVRLGVPRIALYAVSYGTRVALEYARRYPQHVERMILDSAVGIDAPDPFGRETLAAVAHVLRAACRFGCGGAQAHPVADLARLVQRLRRSPIRTTLRHGGHRVPVTVTVDDLLGMLVSGDLAPVFLRRIPPAVRLALHGDVRALAGLEVSPYDLEDDDPVSEFSSALYAATTCEEGPFAWDPSAAAATRLRQARAALAATPLRTLAPFDRASALDFGVLSLCAHWPARTRVPAPEPPLPTTIPALVLSGDLDLRTPLQNARRLARALHGHLVVEQGVGHGVLGERHNGCASPAVAAFLAGRPLAPCRR